MQRAVQRPDGARDGRVDVDAAGCEVARSSGGAVHLMLGVQNEHDVLWEGEGGGGVNRVREGGEGRIQCPAGQVRLLRGQEDWGQSAHPEEIMQERCWLSLLAGPREHLISTAHQRACQAGVGPVVWRGASIEHVQEVFGVGQALVGWRCAAAGALVVGQR